MTALEDEIRHLIVEALMLEDVTPAQIEIDAALFGEGLGLDSIDALELAIAIERKYDVKIEPKDEQTRAIFGSVQTLAAHVGAHRSSG